MNMLEFFTEDVARKGEFQSSSTPFAVSLDEGYSVCPSCGIEIVFEHDHQGFTHCPACGSELLK
jgi:hypothetical protein